MDADTNIEQFQDLCLGVMQMDDGMHRLCKYSNRPACTVDGAPGLCLMRHGKTRI